MPHLIDPLQHKALDDCLQLLKRSHAFLASRAFEAVRMASALPANENWGTAVKRVRVALDGVDRGIVPPYVQEHNLVEVINQCATIGRLVDLMQWLTASPPENCLKEFKHVVCCHPTTSSNKLKPCHNNDLVLAFEKERAKFEVSDVASEADGNGKEKKDLLSLGVLLKVPGARELAVVPPDGRAFLVVSEEFYNGILSRCPYWRNRARGTYCCYVEVAKIGTTVLIEVIVSDAAAPCNNGAREKRIDSIVRQLGRDDGDPVELEGELRALNGGTSDLIMGNDGDGDDDDGGE